MKENLIRNPKFSASWSCSNPLTHWQAGRNLDTSPQTPPAIYHRSLIMEQQDSNCESIDHLKKAHTANGSTEDCQPAYPVGPLYNLDCQSLTLGLNLAWFCPGYKLQHSAPWPFSFISQKLLWNYSLSLWSWSSLILLQLPWTTAWWHLTIFYSTGVAKISTYLHKAVMCWKVFLPSIWFSL